MRLIGLILLGGGLGLIHPGLVMVAGGVLCLCIANVREEKEKEEE